MFNRDSLRDTLSLSSQSVSNLGYAVVVPKLWNDTIETHREAVRDATLDTTAALVAEHGLASVTMSQIATETGIGRATLYKYFSDVDAILLAWHERQVGRHLEQLVHISNQTYDTPVERLDAVLETYALISRRHHGGDLEAQLHRGAHVGHAERQLLDLVRDLIAEAAATGDLRDDVPPGELASYCLHALAAASRLRSRAATRRLVTVTLSGLRP
jgi:AcrR family transcriptional regulator